MATGINSLDDDEEDFLNMFGDGDEDQDLRGRVLAEAAQRGRTTR